MTGGPINILCSDIEDFLKYEQHHLQLTKEYQESNMKAENRYYTEAVV